MRDETGFHAYPDRAGFPRYTIDLVSPEAPSGAGWLANCFIELGIPAWKPWNADDRTHWIELGGHRYRHRLDGSPWSRLLPALVDGRELTFDEGDAVRVHHVWPGVYPRADHTILFVRDPSDALHSAWHRQRRFGAIGDDVDFRAFCASRFHHYPVSWADYLLLFLRVWQRAIAELGGFVVSFEAYRGDAKATLADVLDRLSIRRSAAEIERAVEASSVERVREADDAMVAAGIVATTIIRGEPPGDSVRTHGDTIGDIVRRFDHVIRYPAAPPGAPHDAKTAALLHAIEKAGIPVDPSGWLAGAVRACCGDIELVAGA